MSLVLVGVEWVFGEIWSRLVSSAGCWERFPGRHSWWMPRFGCNIVGNNHAEEQPGEMQLMEVEEAYLRPVGSGAVWGKDVVFRCSGFAGASHTVAVPFPAAVFPCDELGHAERSGHGEVNGNVGQY